MIELLRELEVERSIPVEHICSGIEEAVAEAYRENMKAPESLVVVRVDRETAKIEIMRRRVVVDGEPASDAEVDRRDLPAIYEPGDFIDERVDLGSFQRVAALTARRAIAERVTEYEREAVYEKYRGLVGTIVRGLVLRTVAGIAYVALERDVEAALPLDECVPGERFAIREFVEAEVIEVGKAPRGPMIVLSRARASYVRALFADAKPILASARRPGFVTVLAAARPLDPGEVAAASARLGHERIQVIPWSHDPAEMVAHLLPAESGEVFAIPEHRIVIVESAAATPLQIELARQLTGWSVVRAEPGRSDVALEAHLSAIAASEPAAPEINTNELLRRLEEEFARERDADVA